MANNSNTDSRLVWVKAMERGQCFPLDATEIWYSLEDAQTYAQEDPTAYVGQTIKVIDETNREVKLYTIDITGSLIDLATKNDVLTSMNNLQVTYATRDQVLEILTDYGFIASDFNDVTLSENNSLAFSILPMLKDDGNLMITPLPVLENYRLTF